MSLAQARGRWRQEGRMLLWAILVSAVTCPLGASIQIGGPAKIGPSSLAFSSYGPLHSSSGTANPKMPKMPKIAHFRGQARGGTPMLSRAFRAAEAGKTEWHAPCVHLCPALRHRHRHRHRQDHSRQLAGASMSSEVTSTSVNLVIPVYNEEAALPNCVTKLSEFLSDYPQYDWRITIVDNGSVDQTLKVAQSLESERVRCTHLAEKGRGRALKHAWGEDDSEVQCYMDVDLSTNLTALPVLIDTVASGEWDAAAGSRRTRGASVTGRSFMRGLTSLGYAAAMRMLFPFAALRDAQCGFKAVSREMCDKALPCVRSNGWFFDSELLLMARMSGYRIKEVPVKWVDDKDSRVQVFSTIIEMALSLLELRFRFRQGIPPPARPPCPVWSGSRLWRAMGKLLRGVWRAIGHKLQRIIPSHEAVGGRLSSSWMVRVGFRTDPALKGLERGLPGLTPLAESMTRFVLKRMDEEMLFGLAAIAAGELLSREVDRQIQPLPEDVRNKAYSLVDKSVGVLETKLIEIGSAGWSVDLFLNQEIQKSLRGGALLSGIPLLQDPEFKEAVAGVAQARAQIEAFKVLKNIGLTDAQSSLFLEMNRTLGSIAGALKGVKGAASLPGQYIPASSSAPSGGDGRNVYEKLLEEDADDVFKKFDRNLDGKISWDELWTAVAGSPPPDSIASSFAYLKSVNSGVALSPQLNLLLDAARQGNEKGPAPASSGGNTSTLVWNMSRALSGVLEEEASRTVKLADSLFNTVADSVERGLGESMRTVYYDAGGRRMEDAAELDHVLGKVEREMARPIFEGLFKSLSRARLGWVSTRNVVEKWTKDQWAGDERKGKGDDSEGTRKLEEGGASEGNGQEGGG